MPTVLELFGLRFFFYSGDHEPIHIHVVGSGGDCKIGLVPKVELIYNHGLKPRELKKAVKTVELYHDDIMDAWNKHMANKENGEN